VTWLKFSHVLPSTRGLGTFRERLQKGGSLPLNANGKMYKRGTFGFYEPFTPESQGSQEKGFNISEIIKKEEEKDMRKQEMEVRDRFIKMRMNDVEYKQLEKLWKQTTERHLSNYLRKVCLQKPVIVKYRNQSADDFLSGMLQLKKDLNSIGNNFNMAVRKLHILEKIPEFRTWLLLNESLQRDIASNIEQIKSCMIELYNEWLLK
jgi:hypothetical protein